jgi:hypothetical protein
VNVLTQQKRNTVETLLGKGVSQHEIHRKTGIDRKTIRKIARLIAELGSNSPMATGVGDGAAQIPPPRPPAPKEARSACEPHREWIEAQIRLGRNAMAIYQDLVDHHGFTSRYNSVKRFCRCVKEDRAGAVRPAGISPRRRSPGRLRRRRLDALQRPLSPAPPVRHDPALLAALVPQGCLEIQQRNLGAPA